MATPKVARGTKVKILLGDGATPEVFAAFCGLTAESIAFATETNNFAVPDCDNPDDPTWQELAKASRNVAITGSGVLDTPTLSRYVDAYNSPDPVNTKVMLDVPAIDGGGEFQGKFMLTGFTMTGNQGALVTIDMTLASSGEVLWVPLA